MNLLRSGFDMNSQAVRLITGILGTLVLTHAFGEEPAKATLPAPSTTQATGVKPAVQPVRIYGAQLMTEQERAEFRAKMRSLKTLEERQSFRQQHHEEMKARAKERGVTIPDEPPMRGPRAGNGMGKGKGMQQGNPGGPGPRPQQ
jgi:hypothetical protein